MTSWSKLPGLAVVACGLACAQEPASDRQEWTGTLMSADCSDMRFASSGELHGLATATPTDATRQAGAPPVKPSPAPRNVMTPPAPPGCEVTESTTAFGLITSADKMMKLDTAGNEKIAAQLKSSKRMQKMMQKKDTLRVTVTGTMRAERLVVDKVKF